ncbi:MAG: FkbM family methyltransferase [Bacteroidota bacterium]
MHTDNKQTRNASIAKTVNTYYSQFGEDKILFEVFQKKTKGFCIEVGANNGVDDSTTLFFENLGWKCILVEPNPFLCQQIRMVRNALLYEYAASHQKDTKTLYIVEGAQRSDGLSTISTNEEVHANIERHGFSTQSVSVQTTTLDDILMHAHIDQQIDFISIDVEGHEREVLEGFSIDKWRPYIVLVEDNSELRNTNVVTYLKQYGYVRFKRTGVNDWYAHTSSHQLVNLRSIIKMQWLIAKSKILHLLKQISFLRKIKRLLQSI